MQMTKLTTTIATAAASLSFATAAVPAAHAAPVTTPGQPGRTTTVGPAGTSETKNTGKFRTGLGNAAIAGAMGSASLCAGFQNEYNEDMADARDNANGGHVQSAQSLHLAAERVRFEAQQAGCTWPA